MLTRCSCHALSDDCGGHYQVSRHDDEDKVQYPVAVVIRDLGDSVLLYARFDDHCEPRPRRRLHEGSPPFVVSAYRW